MKNKQQKYKALYEKYFGSLTEKIGSANALSKALAACGHNPTAKFVRLQWNNEFGFSDFVVTAEVLADEKFDLKTAFQKRFTQSLSRFDQSALALACFLFKLNIHS